MKSRFTLVLFAILLLAADFSRAQQENKWVFGYHAGLDFSSGTPVPFTSAMEGFGEGNASVCDASGQLLFYTEGSYVWTRNHTLMPNGSDLTGLTSVTSYTVTSSSSQGAMIIQMPGNSKRYYVFSLSSMEQNGVNNAGKLYYSVVDMTLNGGLGDVVPGLKGILVDSLLSERLTAVVGDRCNIWVLACSVDARIKAYEVNFSGVNTTPVISATGIAQEFAGKLAVSPDGTKLAATKCFVFGGGSNSTMLFDFDITTGIASNPRTILSNDGAYGVCFSPDNSRLYIASGFLRLYQYTVSSGNAAAIQASEVLIGNASMTDLKLAPNGKIYFKISDGTLGALNAPNAAGAACQYTASAVTLAGGTTILSGLPNIVPAFHFSQDTLHSYTETHAVCFADQLLLGASNTNGWGYTWSDGAIGTQRQASSSGLYTVGYFTSPCSYNIDSFMVSFPEIHTINSCADQNIGMAWVKAATGDATVYTYTWKDTNGTVLSTDDTLSGVPAATYMLEVTAAGGCDTKLSIVIGEDRYFASFNADTLVCAGTDVQFQNTSDPYFSSFSWIYGDGNTSAAANPQHAFINAGSYPVTLVASGLRCTDTAIRTVVVDTPGNVGFVVDRDSICTGMSVACMVPAADSTLQYYNWSFGDSTRFNQVTGNVQHAYDEAGIMTIQLTGVFRACAEANATRQVYVGALPKVYLGPDSSLCLDGKTVVLSDHNIQPEGSLYRWSTGATGKSIAVVHHGTYTLTVTGPDGCVNAESVTVLKDCYIDIPNAFTPNGDQVNDYFFPRQLLASGITRFSMQVYNRWGQVVFETDRTDGRGWDGKFNGADQPKGVYVYMIDAEINHNRTERYQGNITLIR